MSSDNMENDHDYLASARTSVYQQNSEEYDEIRVVRSRRRILQLTTQRLADASNSDHDYMYPLEVARNDNNALGALSGTVQADHDIFQDDDDGDVDDADGGGEAVLLGFASGSSETSSNATTSTGSESDTTISSDATMSSDGTTTSFATSNSGDFENNTSTNNPQDDARNPPHLRGQEAVDNNVPSTSQTSTSANNISEVNVSVATSASTSNNVTTVVSLVSPSPPKKRKRLSLEANNKSATPKVKSKDGKDEIDDEDDGLTCPICLDNWEMSGDHRLSSLKCGHLFGESCIRRWLQESARQSGQKVCPQCKTKAHPKEIRYLYAKRLRAIDRSEEHRMRDELCTERSKNQGLELELATVRMSYAQVTQKMKTIEAENEALKNMLRTGGGSVAVDRLETNKMYKSSVSYKLFMERNLELSREPGCRVMTYAEHHSALIVSQKSGQCLFAGYGLRFIDTPSFRPSNFLHTSVKMVRDISLSDDQQLLAVASMEQKAKLFDLRTLQAVAQFKPAEKPLWSCAIARKESEYYLYLGSQHGSTYVYDIRYPETFLDEHQTEADCSPVIQVDSVPESDLFPCGGFIVCKLTSLWFYENIPGGGVQSTRLSIEGRLISMSYDAINQSLLIQTRSCLRHPRARHILGKLTKIDAIPVLDMKVTFFAHTNSPVMVRSTQIAVDSNTLVTAYIQDKKLLSLYDANSEQCIQSLPVQEVVYDTCPIYTKDVNYLAALTETKCRLYKLNVN